MFLSPVKSSVEPDRHRHVLLIFSLAFTNFLKQNVATSKDGPCSLHFKYDLQKKSWYLLQAMKTRLQPGNRVVVLPGDITRGPKVQ